MSGRRLAAAALLLAALTMRGATAAPATTGDDPATILAQYLRIDTTNPPGHEMAGARFLADHLKAAGLTPTIYESAPGRANLIATIAGTDRSLGSFVLLSHIDVVPADARYWKQPPFSGKTIDGIIWGRGAIDMKSMGIAELEAFIALKRSGVRPKRDVVLMAVADEEMGGDAGIKWLMKHHPELFTHIDGVINEEGPGYVDASGKLMYWEVRPGQKGLAWLKLVAHGTPGHGSLPMADSAPNRLVRALNRILAWQTPIKVLPEAQQFFTQLSSRESGARAAQMKDVAASLKDADFAAWFTSNKVYNAMVRNTVSITQLEGSNKTNVIPPQASASLDCRLLPGQDTADWMAQVKAVVDDPHVEVQPLQVEQAVPSSPLGTPLFNDICDVIRQHYPGALVVTPYSRAANDCRYFQEKGIVCYGFVPFALTMEQAGTMHGNDERISADNVRRGVPMLLELIKAFAVK